MRRVTQFGWPLGALVVSFIAMLMLTTLFSTDRLGPSDGSDNANQSTSSDTEASAPSPDPGDALPATMTITGLVVPALTNTPERPWVGGVLVLRGGLVCVDGDLARAGWLPGTDPAWQNYAGAICRQVAAGEVLTVKLVRQ